MGKSKSYGFVGLPLSAWGRGFARAKCGCPNNHAHGFRREHAQLGQQSLMCDPMGGNGQGTGSLAWAIRSVRYEEPEGPKLPNMMSLFVPHPGSGEQGATRTLRMAPASRWTVRCPKPSLSDRLARPRSEREKW